VTYLLRCNTDVTSLLSGTAIKSTIAYVTDYITKTPLKTHTMFEVVRTVFNRNSEFLSGIQADMRRQERWWFSWWTHWLCRLKLEQPNGISVFVGTWWSYTSHTFKSFFWKPYVNEARQVWGNSQDEDVEADRLDQGHSRKVNDTLVGISPVLDYIYRPSIYKETCLYDWICLYTKRRWVRQLYLCWRWHPHHALSR